MHQEPLVSIAIISYNQKEFLRECLESILLQDYQNLEIVIADDGSKDGTHEMLAEYSERHPGRFVLRLSPENQGITRNSNLAHFACSGKYIAWMGGDDLMLPGKISAQVRYMEEHPECSICYHNLDVFDSSSGKSLRQFNSRDSAWSGKIDVAVRHGTFNGACSNMVRAAHCPEHGFDERVRIASDWLYWVQILAKGGEIHYLDRVLGRYRRHGGNVTSRRMIEVTQDHLISCGIILSEMPALSSEVRARTAQLLRQVIAAPLESNRKLEYLRASLGYRLGLKSLVRYGQVKWASLFKAGRRAD